MQNKCIYSTFILFMTLLLSCGGSGPPGDFQINEDPDFRLTDVTDGFGAVDSAYESIDSREVNDRLETAVSGSEEFFSGAAYSVSDLMDASKSLKQAQGGSQSVGSYAPLPDVVRSDLSGLMTLIIDRDQQGKRYTRSGVDSFWKAGADAGTEGLHAFLEKFDSPGVEVPKDYISGLLDKALLYAFDAIPLKGGSPDKAWLNEQVDDLLEDFLDDDFQDDLMNVAETLNKLTLQTDYPMWIDNEGLPFEYSQIDPRRDKNLNLGNTVQGTHDMTAWLNRLMRNSGSRRLIHALMENLSAVLDPSPETDLAGRMRQLLINLEDHFTRGGEIYESNPIYSSDSDQIYSDAELSQALRTIMPLLAQLSMRSDRPNALIMTHPGQDPVYPLDLMVKNLRAIGFDPDEIDVERSFLDLLRCDPWGRDRRIDPDAWDASFLESVLFATFVTSHFGWSDGGANGEITDRTNPSSDHGHGVYIENLTMNDGLFSMGGKKMLNLLGLYDITFRAGDGNHIYRSKTPFVLQEVDDWCRGGIEERDYRFFFDQNYPVLQMLAGAGPGDLGSATGGNREGRSLGMNEYRAYAPNGLNIGHLAAWTMGWGVRACFNGEGPYYYADPDAERVALADGVYRKYLRPDGKVYALVKEDGSIYLYPAEEGDTEDLETDVLAYNRRRQRDNRYKSQWQSDHIVIHWNGATPAQPLQTRDRFFTLDNQSGNTQLLEISGDSTPAGNLTFNESIAETDPARACASPQEAFFRNFQWVFNEKKMVLVLPFYLDLGFGHAALVQIVECHGWSGVANARKYKDNHVWAKKGSDGYSTIPGDYRLEVVTKASFTASIAINDDIVYNEILGSGTPNPAVISHNLIPLCRMAFPRSPAMDRGNGVIDQILGSKDFNVGDSIWNDRNALCPLLFCFSAGLREYTPLWDQDEETLIRTGLRSFLNQMALISKPLFSYNKDDADNMPPMNTWIPRVYGAQPVGDYRGHLFLQPNGEFYSTIPDTWFGSWDEMRFYQPMPTKTLLNVLIDSDILVRDKRCDGVLPLLVQTRFITNLIKLLQDPDTGTVPLEQIVSAVKYTKSEHTRINESGASGKRMIFPDWMFAQGVEATKDAYGAYTEYENVRDEDLVLDDLLDRTVGHDRVDARHEGYGLADYPDDKPRDRDWEDFNDDVDTLADLLHPDSPYSITPNLIQIMDRVFARDALYTSSEIKGLLSTVGRLCGRRDPQTGHWVYQGAEGFDDFYRILKVHIPAMDAVIRSNEVPDPESLGGAPDYYGIGDHYYNLLTFGTKLSAPGGLFEYFLNDIEIPENWETTLADFERFFRADVISDLDTELWPTILHLLRDLADAVEEAHNSDQLDEVCMEYGFQVN